MSAFQAALAPASLAEAVIAEYYLPLGVAVVFAVPLLRRQLSFGSGALHLLPLMLWSLTFSLGNISCFDGGPMEPMAFARFGLVSFLALVPIVVLTAIMTPAKIERRGWYLGALIAMATAMCDWALALLAVTPLPRI